MKLERMNVHGQDIEIADKKMRDIVGSGELSTDSKTIIGAINEIKSTPLDVNVGVDEVNNILILETKEV